MMLTLAGQTVSFLKDKERYFMKMGLSGDPLAPTMGIGAAQKKPSETPSAPEPQPQAEAQPELQDDEG